MASHAEPIPAILCGKTLQVGEKVAPAIYPEIQVIHFINSLADAKNNIGELLAGNGPKTPSANHIGTHDYSKPPRAIIFGRAFTLEDVKELNSLYRGIASKPVAWIAGDPDVVPPAHPDAAYAAKGADDVKKALKRWTEAGANSEDIVLY